METGATAMPGKYNEKSKETMMKYTKENIAAVKFTLNKRTELDLLTWIEMQPNKQGYIKSLIRADMEKNK